MLHDRYMEAFYMVAQSESFSLAAEALYCSKATVIQQINFLEERLAFKLFSRTNKGVKLTREGELFLRELNKLKRNLDPVISQCRMAQVDNVVRIGTLPNFRPTLLVDVCREFKKRYPDILVQFVECPLKSYFRIFESGQFNITSEYMVEYNDGRSSYVFHKMIDDEIVCAVPLGHPLYENSCITLDDLRGQRIKMYAKKIDRGSDLVREYLIKNVPNLRVVDIKSYDGSMALDCELTQSLLYLPAHCANSFPTMKVIPFDIGRTFTVALGCSYHADSGPAVQKFMSLVQEMYPNA